MGAGRGIAAWRAVRHAAAASSYRRAPHLVDREWAGELAGLAVEAPRVDAFTVLTLRDVLGERAGRDGRAARYAGERRW